MKEQQRNLRRGGQLTKQTFSHDRELASDLQKCIDENFPGRIEGWSKVLHDDYGRN